MKHYTTVMDSPVGKLTLVATEDSLVAVLWENDNPNRIRLSDCSASTTNKVLKITEAQLLEYFQGDRRTFNLPLKMMGTAFQKDVWNALINIPYGETVSYGELAQTIGSPEAARAVGAANGKNPISIIIPCHRVIGANGGLTGFAGGLRAKKVLLDLEKH